MSELRDQECPECSGLDRRELLRYVSMAAPAAVIAGTALKPTAARAAQAATAPLKKTPAADALVKELYSGMTDEQKKAVCRPYDNSARLSVNPNHALDKEIGAVYTKPQQELIERILKAMSSGDEAAWNQITRGGTWDNSKAFVKTGANIFGDPLSDKYAFLFTGHHLTLRCDGDCSDGVAFGGPIYYGHTPNPYSDKNVFYYQTKQAMKFFDGLDEKHRQVATITKGAPGEGAPSIKLPHQAQGVSYSDLSGDQKDLMNEVMRSILSPFRKEDVDEVMSVIKQTGGMDKLQFAFFNEPWESVDTNDKRPWSFWRIEGPGFVWNFRVLPHVHTFVNISAKA